VTTRDRPSGGTRRVGFRSDLGQVKTEIFLQKGLDTISENQKRFARRVDLPQPNAKNLICHDGQISTLAELSSRDP
jgi:hypothetical protein